MRDGQCLARDDHLRANLHKILIKPFGIIDPEAHATVAGIEAGHLPRAVEGVAAVKEHAIRHGRAIIFVRYAITITQ